MLKVYNPNRVKVSPAPLRSRKTPSPLKSVRVGSLVGTAHDRHLTALLNNLLAANRKPAA